MALGEIILNSSAGSFKLSCTFSLDIFGVSLSPASDVPFLELIYILATVSLQRHFFCFRYEDLQDET